MALQELSPLPQITGGAALGAAILQGGQTYQNRMANLADQQSAREFASTEAEKERGYRSTEAEKAGARTLANERELQQQRLLAASVQALINEGFLDGSQRSDPQAVAAAYQRAQAAGLEKLYQEMLETPGDNGRPLLTVEEIADPAKVAEAKNKLGAIKAKQLQFSFDQRQNAQATVNDIQGQLAQVRARAAQVAASIDAPLQQYRPDSPEVMQLASALAEQVKPGSGRDREAVAAMAPDALKKLNEQAVIQHSLQVQSASRELEALRNNEAQLTAALREAMETFKVAPRPGTTPAALQTPSRPTGPKAATTADIEAAMRAVVGGGKTAPAPAPAAEVAAGPALLDNPTSDPTIAAGNEAIQRQAKAQLQSQLNATLREAETIDRELATVRAGGTNLPAAVSPQMGLGLATPKVGPIGAAQEVSDLLKRKAATDAKVRTLQAQLMGPTPAAVTAPVANTATTSTPTLGAAAGAPEWWRTNATLEPVR
jgi:hypothetical protein